MIVEPALEDLYREVILDHFRHPRHPGWVDDPDVTVRGSNPLCGDELALTLRLAGRRIEEIRFEGKGCSISLASASMLTCAVRGRSIEEALELDFAFRKMLLEGAPADDLPDELDDLRSLEGVRRYPVRVKCALLSWNVLEKALSEVEVKSR